MGACIHDPEPGHQAVTSGLWGCVAASMKRLRVWRNRAALEAALADLEDYQLDDLGVTRSEIPAYAKASPHARQHMTAMVDSLGIGPEWVRPGSQACSELLRGCRLCLNVAACESWLLTAHPAQGYRMFCPNAALLDRLPRRAAVTPADA